MRISWILCDWKDPKFYEEWSNRRSGWILIISMKRLTMLISNVSGTNVYSISGDQITRMIA